VSPDFPLLIATRYDSPRRRDRSAKSVDDGRRRLRSVPVMWRAALDADDDAIVELCSALYVIDPGPHPVSREQIESTLGTFRRDPARGKAVVLEIAGAVVGYALLAAFWSNEFGGDVCVVDELFVADSHRGRGHGSELLHQLPGLWGRPIMAAAVETSPGNDRARRLYERAGFRGANVSMVRPA
jgi:GNAT superfamily N-acetyltransferase